jgi:hypothetical protein
LFLRKQLAFYQERIVRPQRLTDSGCCSGDDGSTGGMLWWE